MLADVAIIILLVVANGIFAGAEIAILTTRRSRLEQLLARGRRGARAVLSLRRDPERFLATVQIGITIVSATAAAFGGASIAARLEPYVREVTWLAPYARELSLALVVGLVSYLSLVIGELVPKSLALRHGAAYSLLVGRPLVALSWLARPLVWFLTASSNVVLRPFGDRTNFIEARVSLEELQDMVEEAAKSGAVDSHAGEIATRALEFASLKAVDVMVPRNRIDAIPRDASPELLKQLLLERRRSRMPVYDGTLDEIVGYVATTDLVSLVWEGELIVLSDLIRPPFFVPESMPAPELMHALRERQTWIAFVVDEHGGLAGLVTLEDLIEELVGEIFSEDAKPEVLVRAAPDGGHFVVGHAPIREVNRALGLQLPEGEGWTTIAGLCFALAHGIPAPGARLEAGGTALEIIEATDKAVRLVRVSAAPLPQRAP